MHLLIISVRGNAVLGDITVFQATTPFLKLPSRPLDAVLLWSKVGSRPAFRVSSVVIRSMFMNVISIPIRSPTLSSKQHALNVTVAPPSASTMNDVYSLRGGAGQKTVLFIFQPIHFIVHLL